MKRTRRRKCLNCGELLRPDSRNRRHQRHCGKEHCRQASKRASQRKWQRKPENRSYFRGPEQVERTRQWRAAHPGYWRRSPLQDVCKAQAAENNSESGTYNAASCLKPGPLQDVLQAQAAVLIGLIATLTGTALQEDIASISRHLISVGQDVFRHGETGGKETASPQVSALHSGGEFQLGGPTNST